VRIKDYINYLVDSMYSQLGNCIKLNLLCRDPPAVTSQILRSLGLNDYYIRRFWELFKNCLKEGRNSITLYRYKGIVFKAEVEVKTNAICFIEPTAFIDIFECEELNYKYNSKLITNANTIYIYVKGYVNNELFIKINAIYLLKKLFDLGETNTVNSIKILSKKLANNSLTFNDIKHIVNLFKTLLRFSCELREIGIYVPKDENETIRLIPILAKLRGL